jgi:hypothetical protein
MTALSALQSSQPPAPSHFGQSVKPYPATVWEVGRFFSQLPAYMRGEVSRLYGLYTILPTSQKEKKGKKGFGLHSGRFLFLLGCWEDPA